MLLLAAKSIIFWAPCPTLAASFTLSLDGVSYGTGHLGVAVNAILGKGTVREAGLNYQKAVGSSLNVASIGNFVENVGVLRTVGAGVTVTVIH